MRLERIHDPLILSLHRFRFEMLSELALIKNQRHCFPSAFWSLTGARLPGLERIKPEKIKTRIFHCKLIEDGLVAAGTGKTTDKIFYAISNKWLTKKHNVGIMLLVFCKYIAKWRDHYAA